MTTQPTHALSIRQPWAWAICHAGKDVENRDWSTRFRGPVWIHASKGMTHAEYEDFLDVMGIIARSRTMPEPWPEYALERGGIVGRANLVDCVEQSDSPWFFGRYGFVLADAQPVPFRPCRGKMGFFVPDMGSAT